MATVEQKPPIGTMVRVDGLSVAAHLNGKEAIVVAHIADNDRVELDFGDEHGLKRVRALNCVPLLSMDAHSTRSAVPDPTYTEWRDGPLPCPPRWASDGAMSRPAFQLISCTGERFQERNPERDPVRECVAGYRTRTALVIGPGFGGGAENFGQYHLDKMDRLVAWGAREGWNIIRCNFQHVGMAHEAFGERVQMLHDGIQFYSPSLLLSGSKGNHFTLHLLKERIWRGPTFLFNGAQALVPPNSEFWRSAQGRRGTPGDGLALWNVPADIPLIVTHHCGGDGMPDCNYRNALRSSDVPPAFTKEQLGNKPRLYVYQNERDDHTNPIQASLDFFEFRLLPAVLSPEGPRELIKIYQGQGPEGWIRDFDYFDDF